MNQPVVSIIIPTYNRGHLIEKAIESIYAQTYPNWQLIVIDDGSTDDTRERLSVYNALDYHVQANRGRAAARNAGLAYCRGEYIASLDADCAWHPTFLATGVGMLEKHRLDFVFMNWTTATGDGGYTSYFRLPKHKRRYCTEADNDWWVLNAGQTRRLLVDTCPAPSSALLIRRLSFPVAWNEQLRTADDWCLLLDVVLNQPVRSAFTPIPHWLKTTHDAEVRVNRDQPKPNPDWQFQDEMALFTRFKKQLRTVEKRSFRRRLAMHHVNLAYATWKQSVASVKVFQHLGTAFWLSPVAIGLTLVVWGQTHVKKRLLIPSR